MLRFSSSNCFSRLSQDLLLMALDAQLPVVIFFFVFSFRLRESWNLKVVARIIILFNSSIPVFISNKEEIFARQKDYQSNIQLLLSNKWWSICLFSLLIGRTNLKICEIAFCTMRSPRFRMTNEAVKLSRNALNEKTKCETVCGDAGQVESPRQLVSSILSLSFVVYVFDKETR